MLDRNGIQRLALVYTRRRLGHEFGVSVPTLRTYLRGREPREAIAKFINEKITLMLGKKGIPVVALERYCNDYANFRLSMDEREPGPDCKYRVLRYPLGPCTQTFLVASNTLYLRKKDIDKVMHKRYPKQDMMLQLAEMGIVTGTNRLNMNEGSGLEKRLSECYVIDLADERLEDLVWLLQASAKREMPEQEGRILNSLRTV
jgi:hypothetical protein